MDEPVVLTKAALGIRGLGEGRLAQLRDAFGTVTAAVQASRAGAPPPSGVPESLFRTLGSRLDRERAARDIAGARAAGLDVVCWDDAAYPLPLWMAPVPPPPLLYVQGALPAAFALPAYRVPAAAVVGTRRATARGLTLARELSAALASLGVVIVSGLALGIDGAAHEGALDAAGCTVAVLGGGHGHLHPAIHRGLARRIVRAGGALLSQYPPDARPDRHTFPERNAVISGLSRVVVVVEAGARSGASLTARYAVQQNRDLYACPGRPGDPSVAGTLALIRDGALILAEHEDVLARFREGRGSGPDVRGGPEPAAAAPARPPAAAEPLLAALYAVEEATLDQLARALGADAPALTARLTSLEIAGLVERSASGRYRLVGSAREARNAWERTGGGRRGADAG